MDLPPPLPPLATFATSSPHLCHLCHLLSSPLPLPLPPLSTSCHLSFDTWKWDMEAWCDKSERRQREGNDTSTSDPRNFALWFCIFVSVFCISYFGVSDFPCNINEWCQCEGMTHWTRGISWWCWASAVLWYSAGQVLYAGQAHCCAGQVLANLHHSGTIQSSQVKSACVPYDVFVYYCICPLVS